MKTQMGMGTGFFATVGCCLILAGCNGMDQTWATPPPAEVAPEGEPAVPDPEPPENAAPEPEPPTPNNGGIEPVGGDGEDPIPETPSPEAPSPEAPSPDTPSPEIPPVVDVDPPEPEPPAAFDCSTVPAAPVTFEELEGFASSEDFAFDELGNYVGVDDNGNLIRVSKEGEKQLWSPSIGATAGMGILPDGSVVICDVGEGALKRVYPNGAVSVVLGGLLYPNGLDIGPDGFVYVAENAGGRVRRVNPDTGEFTIVALGLKGPNGVAFTNDPSLLYVGSFEGSGVYKIELPAPGELGHASVFARPNGSTLREPIIACPDNEEGLECDTEWYGTGRCQALANVVDCLPIDQCPNLPDGTYCSYPVAGTCEAGQCVEQPNPCDGIALGEACEDPIGGPGVCQEFLGQRFCEPPNPCEGLEPGAACENPFFGAGVCEGDAGYMYCTYRDPCEGRAEGDACEDPFYGAGECIAGGDYLYCAPPNPCEGAEAGAACEDPYFGEGECVVEQGFSYCQPPNACEGLEEGAPCSDYFTPEGHCFAFEGRLSCIAPNVCDDLEKNDRCDDFGFEGVCVPYEGHLYCGYPDVCDTLEEGDACSNEFIESGTCAFQGGRLMCTPPNPCDGLSEGATCTDRFARVGAGICLDNYGEGTLSCLSAVCVGLEDGARCEDPEFGPGRCYSGICYTGANGPGGIDGMGVDTCGNVYATEYIHGNVWRISPAGEIELLVELPSAWIPNVKWGRDLGGFSSQVMYVADRLEGRLFGVAVGVPGATEFFASQP